MSIKHLVGHLEFPVENLKSGNGFEDRELRRRIDSRRYPVHLRRSEVDEARPTRIADYIVSGDLTFRGVTRTYEDQMTIDDARRAHCDA